MKILHVTSAHNRDDIRIYKKQCISLSKLYDVHLLVADGKGDELVNGVTIIDAGKPKSRIYRLSQTTRKIYKLAKDLDADLYHLHDPELLPIALKLKNLGKKVIFDAHEDLPKQLLSKPYLNPHVAKLVSFVMKHYEHYVCAKLDAIISATPAIQNKFDKFTKLSITVNNYPLIGELQPQEKDWSNIKNEIAYVGGINKIRGIHQLVESLTLVNMDIKLNLVGVFSDSETYHSVKNLSSWSLVEELGQLDRQQVKSVLERSIAGVVTFLPVPNHIESQPNKMFEYMSAGIPVIGSNFPLWKDIIEKNNCGICVDPQSPSDIAKAINMLVNNKSLAMEMGRNGAKAVIKKYNWTVEEAKLINLYKTVLENNT